MLWWQQIKPDCNLMISLYLFRTLFQYGFGGRVFVQLVQGSDGYPLIVREACKGFSTKREENFLLPSNGSFKSEQRRNDKLIHHHKLVWEMLPHPWARLSTFWGCKGQLRRHLLYILLPNILISGRDNIKFSSQCVRNLISRGSWEASGKFSDGN